MIRHLFAVVVAAGLISASVHAQSENGVEAKSPQESVQSDSLPAAASDGLLSISHVPPDNLRGWRKPRFLDPSAMPTGILEDSATAGQIANNYAAGCRNSGSYYCLQRDAFRGMAERLGAANAAYPGCDRAAADFRQHYEDADPPAGVARAYDLECLGSFVERVSDADSAVQEERPSLLDGQNEHALLGIVGLMWFDGTVQCAGLIRPDGTFITARHCLLGAGAAKLTLQSADGAFSGAALAPDPRQDSNTLGVPGDWAILTIAGQDVSKIAASNLVQMDVPGEVEVVGMYPYFNDTSYAKNEQLPREGLRYPRRGMCESTSMVSGCLQLVCQTVRGFSGAPIFTKRRPDGSFDVIGFISGNEGSDSNCHGLEKLNFDTLAVSADVVGAAHR